MDVATISANGQITLPVDVRTRLRLGPGDKCIFRRLSNAFPVWVVTEVR